MMPATYYVTPASCDWTLKSVAYQLRNLAAAGYTAEVAEFLSGMADLVAPAPPPVLDSIAPTTGEAGGEDVWITCTGSGFVSRSKIYFNNGTENTTFVSETEVKTLFKGSTASTAGAYPVKVVTTAPGGGSSAEIAFTVTEPARREEAPAPEAWWKQ